MAMETMADNGRKAIVVVSFGTTFPATRRACIESIENRIAEAFPDYTIRRAFTSRFVIRHMAEQEQIQVDTLEQALARLQQEGFREVIIQPTHLTAGEEYDNKILAVQTCYAASFTKFTLSRPALFYSGEHGLPDDYAAALQALQAQMPADTAVLLVGHGSPNRHNPAYKLMQDRLDRAGLNAVVGVVEEADRPNFEDALALLQQRGIHKVILMPLLLVAGEHAQNDMIGEQEDSWKNRLLRAGFAVDAYLHGLGENRKFQDIYIQHVRDAIAGLPTFQ